MEAAAEVSVPRALVWRDADGNTYKVMPGIGGRSYKGRKNRPGSDSWRCMRQLGWADSFERAQADLNGYAEERGWHPMSAPR